MSDKFIKAMTAQLHSVKPGLSREGVQQARPKLPYTVTAEKDLARMAELYTTDPPSTFIEIAQDTGFTRHTVRAKLIEMGLFTPKRYRTGRDI